MAFNGANNTEITHTSPHLLQHTPFIIIIIVIIIVIVIIIIVIVIISGSGSSITVVIFIRYFTIAAFGKNDD